MASEGYNLLPKELRAERDERIIELFDTGYKARAIAGGVRLSYEGVRRILRKAGRMGKGNA